MTGRRLRVKIGKEPSTSQRVEGQTKEYPGAFSKSPPVTSYAESGRHRAGQESSPDAFPIHLPPMHRRASDRARNLFILLSLFHWSLAYDGICASCQGRPSQLCATALSIFSANRFIFHKLIDRNHSEAQYFITRCHSAGESCEFCMLQSLALRAELF